MKTIYLVIIVEGQGESVHKAFAQKDTAEFCRDGLLMFRQEGQRWDAYVRPVDLIHGNVDAFLATGNLGPQRAAGRRT